MPSELDERVLAAATALEAAVAEPERLSELDGRILQGLLGSATRAFAARREAGDALEAFAADGPTAAPTPTDVVVTVSAMLESSAIELFELGLWQTWGDTLGTREGPDDEH